MINHSNINKRENIAIFNANEKKQKKYINVAYIFRQHCEGGLHKNSLLTNDSQHASDSLCSPFTIRLICAILFFFDSGLSTNFGFELYLIS